MSEETGGQAGGSYEDRARTAPKAPKPPKERSAGSADEGPDPDAWMVTFSDLLTLLMTFFVLIFASQAPIQEKVLEAFGQSAGVFGRFRTSFFEQISAIARKDISQDRIQIFLDEIGATDVDVSQEEQGLVITIPSQALFAPSAAKLTEQARKRLGQVSEVLRFTRHEIRVAGHSDDRETAGGASADGWELSLARAHAVLQDLIGNRIPESRLSLNGFGPSRPRFDNRSAAGRARNRRVEIVILNRGDTP